MNGSNSMIGIYGKLPEHRDFVQRNLPEAVLHTWHRWLTAGMEASTRALGDHGWEQCYLGAPIWRFVLPAGALSELAWAGSLMPSVDGSGRHFPLTLLWALPEGQQPVRVVRRAGDVYDALEEAMLSVLEESLDFVGFEAGLAKVDLSCFADVPMEHPRLEVLAAAGRVCRRVSVDAADALDDMLDAQVDGDRLAELGAYSVWWTRGSERTRASLLFFSGMPAADDFHLLLDAPQDASGAGDETPAAVTGSGEDGDREPGVSARDRDDGRQPGGGVGADD